MDEIWKQIYIYIDMAGLVDIYKHYCLFYIAQDEVHVAIVCLQ